MVEQPTHQSVEPDTEAIRHVVDKLRSTHDGDSAVLELVAYGNKAIPALRTLLFSREPSGLYEARVRAIEALAKLDAHHILVEFLKSRRDVIDPVERLGEDAVINAAARNEAYRSEPGLFELLLELGQRPCLTGVIFALGTFRNTRTIPLLIQALSEDVSRLTAEVALKRIGVVARPALLEIVTRTRASSTYRSESQLRQCRSALGLLAEMGVSPKMWRNLRPLMHDNDPRIAITACELCLSIGSAPNQREAVHRLIRLSANVDWAVRDEIERYLIAHLHVARSAIPTSSELEALKAESETVKDFVERILQRAPRAR